MKTFSLLTLATLLTSGCEHCSDNNSHWDRDCQKNYSENSYELAACKDKIEKHETFKKESGTVGMDPDNVNRPTQDDMHKMR